MRIPLSATGSVAAAALLVGLVPLAAQGLEEGPALTAPASTPAPPAVAPGTLAFEQTAQQQLSTGVTHTTYRVRSQSGASTANLLTVDLSRKRTDLLTAPYVAQRVRLDDMADDAGALAAVNADYFNMFEDATHPGVLPTDAAVGTEVRDGKIRKYAVPYAQRFGEYPPRSLNDGTEVIGVLRNGTGLVDRIELEGFINSEPTGKVALNGLNQYGMARDQITAFDEQWGPRSRERVGCGSETRRTDPCTDDVLEVIVTHGQVTAVNAQIGAGQLARGQFALVGREAGADVLADLELGDDVSVRWKGAGRAGKFDWAVGGGLMVSDGELAPIPARPLNPRTMAGVSADGDTMYLLVVDGRSSENVGVTALEIAWFMQQLGAWDAVTFDGGASSAMVGRTADQPLVELLSRPYTGSIRPVPNAVGVFDR